ncbi:hypothetical protein, partial [Micromonospora sp. NPDC005806]|uniref:hypothetical protein n=1 Tax=Micromonospora sp. NPDC005806 TaxID=3364234 RepID=UPI0036A59245
MSDLAHPRSHERPPRNRRLLPNYHQSDDPIVLHQSPIVVRHLRVHMRTTILVRHLASRLHEGSLWWRVENVKVPSGLEGWDLLRVS